MESMAQKSTIGRTVLLGSLRVSFAAAPAISPRLAAAGAARLFLRTRRYPLTERERAYLQGARRSVIAGDQGPLTVWEWGVEGKPAVALLHGWEGRCSQLGAFVEPLVANGFRVVGADAMGHGESPGRSSSLVAIAAALRALAEHHGPFAGVVAHSAGTVGAIYALANGVAMDRLVCVAPGVDLDGYARDFARLFGLSPEASRRMRRRIERRIGVSWDDLDPRRAAADRRVPLLVVHDRADREAPFAGGEALAHAWPGSRLLVTEGLGHRRILSNEKVIAAAMDFLGEAKSRESAPRAVLARG
jgi:pimeloyl-ACP methyl ester carboxylesterase